MLLCCTGSSAFCSGNVASSAAASVASACAAFTVIKSRCSEGLRTTPTPFIPLISCTLAAAFGQANLHKYFTQAQRKKLIGDS